MKCSDFIVKFLKKNGIDVVFDMAGGMIAHIEDSVSKESEIRCVTVRHEQAAGFAAEGYSRIKENFGVAMATSGPGATNLITAIGNCYFDSTPVLFITGQVNTAEIKKNKYIRQNGFQETDIVSIVKPITKYAYLILDPTLILFELEKALFVMRDRRYGPVLLDIPFNIQNSDISVNKLKRFVGSKEHKALLQVDNKKISKSDICSKLDKLIKDSKAPIIIVGNGISLSNTKNELLKFSKANNIPLVCSLLGLDSVDSKNDYSLGFIGTYGNRTGNIVLANSDLVIALGSRLDLRQTADLKLFSRNKKIVHVDIDKYSAKFNDNKNIFINLDLKSFFSFTKDIKNDKKEGWFEFIRLIKDNFKRQSNNNEKYLDPNIFYEKFSEIAPDNSIVTADVGQNQMWLAQSWKVKDGQKLLFSGGMGAMGFSLPAAIGAYLADSDKNVFSFSGDGGFQINIQELETIKNNNIPIKIFVLNNYSLGMIREFQDQYFNSNYQSTVIGYSCPDICKIAAAYGIKYYKIDTMDQKDGILDSVIREKQPVIIEIILDSNSELHPKVVYGQSLDNQIPYLDKNKLLFLNNLKKQYLNV